MDDRVPQAELRRIEDLWFDDGNIILQAGNAQYRVHRSTLARRSPVFKDMLSFPQPVDAELVEGNPLVRLPDPEEEVTPFLMALFDPEFFLPFPSFTDFNTIYGCLRLSHKYEVAGLRRRALVHLSSRFRTTILQHDDLADSSWPASDSELWEINPQLSDVGTWKEPKSTYLVSVIALAREVGALWVLPAAFYHLTTDIVGYRVGGMGDEGKDTSLSLHDQANLARGSDAQMKAAFGITQLFQNPRHTKGCASPDNCLTGRLDLVEDSQEMFADYLRDPLEVWIEGHWADYEERLCKVCVSAIKENIADARCSFWDDLPDVYGLPSWEELGKMKLAEIGQVFC
ncbi:hypothetical protein C8F01DRAFT_5919 [Mycena amicta]|nr:hypothetical protein C8F01DRAFT_5919 [Mycena amicta]